jgi:hypothetical protein
VFVVEADAAGTIKAVRVEVEVRPSVSVTT